MKGRGGKRGVKGRSEGGIERSEGEEWRRD